MVNPIKAALYARVSSDEQTDNFSLESQISLMRSYAKAQGFQILEDYIYQEDYTGTALERPELRKLLEATGKNIDCIKNNLPKEIDVVIFLAADRLARKSSVAQAIRDMLANHAVSIHYVTRGEIGFSPEEQAFSTVEDAFAQLWRDKLLETMKRGRVQKAANGLPVYSSKHPFGYRYHGKKRETRIEVVPEEAEIIREMFHLFDEGLSTMEIAEEFNRRGVPLPKPSNQRLVTEWTHFAIRHFLKQKKYTGQGTAFQYVYVKREDGKYVRRKRPAEETYPVAYPPIIEPALWYRAQERIKKNTRNRQTSKKHLFLLADHLYCSCGKKCLYKENTYRSPEYPDEERSYRSYACPGRERLADQSLNHQRCAIPTYLLDTAVWGFIVELLQNRNTLEQRMMEQQAIRQSILTQIEERIASVDLALGKRQRDLENLIDMELENRHDSTILVTLAKKKSATAFAIRELEQQKRDLFDQAQRHAATEYNLNIFTEFAKQVCTSLEHATLPEQKKILNLADVLVTLDYADKFTSITISLLGGIYRLTLPEAYQHIMSANGTARKKLLRDYGLDRYPKRHYHRRQADES